MQKQQQVEPAVGKDVSDRMLYDPVQYRSGAGSWHKDFLEAIKQTPGHLTWDPAAVHAVLSYGYPCGNRTLVSQVSRKPWFSSIESDGGVRLLDIPRHGRLAPAAEAIAANLGRLLEDEIVGVARGSDKIVVLLSGGLDSRIIAGITARALRKGRINASVTGVTWGIPGCRDVAYGKATAEALGMKWQHVNLEPEHLLTNIGLSAERLGSLSYPVHLHRMHWFSQMPPETLVIAGSYGDSVGRAEFSGKHLLELAPLSPGRAGGVMSAGAYAHGDVGLKDDLLQLRARADGEPRFAICELEMQGHYMRGLISHVMNAVNDYCSLYQAFTHPSVFEYMWSLHPSCRTDSPYAALLQDLGEDLAAIPWARTNRALNGPTRGADSVLQRQYHNYEKWISGELLERLHQELDIPALASTGLFNPEALRGMIVEIRKQKAPAITCHHLVWLLSLQRLIGLIAETGRQVEPYKEPADAPRARPIPPPSLRVRLARIPILVKGVHKFKRFTRWRIRRRAFRDYPPEKPSSETASDHQSGQP